MCIRDRWKWLVIRHDARRWHAVFLLLPPSGTSTNRTVTTDQSLDEVKNKECKFLLHPAQYGLLPTSQCHRRIYFFVCWFFVWDHSWLYFPIYVQRTCKKWEFRFLYKKGRISCLSLKEWGIILLRRVVLPRRGAKEAFLSHTKFWKFYQKR